MKDIIKVFCFSAPSCAPARASMLTGQDIWRLEEAANLWGSFPAKFQVYTEMLEDAGYLVGYEGKGWGPGITPLRSSIMKRRKDNPSATGIVPAIRTGLLSQVDGKRRVFR